VNEDTVSLGRLLGLKRSKNHSRMEADSVNWDTIMELLPVGEGDDYEERVK
jgi:hypothetical protein